VFKGLKLGKNIPDFYELVTAPVMKVGYVRSVVLVFRLLGLFSG